MSKHSQPFTPARRNAGGAARDAAITRATEAFEADDVDGALTLLADAEATWPDEPRIPCLIGKYTADRKLTADGIAKLEAVLQRFPKHVPTLLELGGIYLKPGNMVKANPYIQQALELAPRAPGPHCSMGALQQRLGNLPEAVEQFRTALKLQLKAHVEVGKATAKAAAFRVEDAEGLLWRTLALMAKNGVHMFAAFGSLLGLTRNGALFAHDKDIDSGVPFSEMERAIAILCRNGWIEANHSFGFSNPRAMYHTASRISMDVSGFVIDEHTGKALTAGAWMPGLPKEWNMIFEFDRIELEKRPVPKGEGEAWCMRDPEAWLAAIYGNWRVPDKNFDTMVRARNIRGFSLLAKCFAYSRIFEHWSNGNLPRATALARHTLTRDPTDALMQKVVSRLNH